MSAPSPMGRTAMMTVALAAFAVTAHGAPATHAHPHKKAASAAAAHHVAAQTATARSTYHPHEKKSSVHEREKSRTSVSGRHSRPSRLIAAHPEDEAALHRSTPEEVGRAAGLKIRSQMASSRRTRYRSEMRHRNSMDRRTVLRRSRERHEPELVRARYTPGDELRGPETDDTDSAAQMPGRDAAAEARSGSTHYESVDDGAESSASAGAAESERDPAAARQAADIETDDIDRSAPTQQPVAPPAATATSTPRRRASAPTGVTVAGTVASTVANVDTPGPATGFANTSVDDARNAAHPSFERHARVAAPEDAPAFDNRAPAKQLTGENANDYDLTEDRRLRAETEEASLSIARGYMPAPLRGNRASLERQNERLEAEGLERIEDEADLAERIAHHLLVPVPVSDALTINANLPVNHRYCRPWTARFLADLAAAHEAKFHKPLEVSSAVRTVEYQKKLMMVNGNAAPAEGDVVSPHLTGATIDIAKDNLSRAEMAWMRRYLLTIEAEGKIDVEEEFQQACFHIAVYKDYVPSYHPAPSRGLTSPSQAHTGRGKRHAAPAPVVADGEADGL